MHNMGDGEAIAPSLPTIQKEGETHTHTNKTKQKGGGGSMKDHVKLLWTMVRVGVGH